MPLAWLEGGSTRHLLGTDHLGRDVLSRLVYGVWGVSVPLIILGTMWVLMGPAPQGPMGGLLAISAVSFLGKVISVVLVLFLATALFRLMKDLAGQGKY